MMIRSRFCLLVGSMLLLAAAAPREPGTATVAWVKRHAVAMGPADSDLDRDEAAVIAKIISGARVIGLGEPFHGHEEPLAYRNRLVRHLVAHEGLTAVALETGIAETKRVGDYVLGGPGEATAIVRDNLSWRFNTLASNVQLVAWLRAYNAANPARRVRLYGIDVSGGDERTEFGRSRASLDYLTAYLQRAAPQRSRPVRLRLAAFAEGFSNAGYAQLSAADRAALHDALVSARAFLANEATALIGATSREDLDWAMRIADDALDAERIFAVWPSDTARPMPGAALVAGIRDKAMAANTRWALDREGPRGRILLFESNSHVAAAPMRRPDRQSDAGNSAGQELRRALGGAYRVIVTASSLGKTAGDPAIGTVDGLLVGAGPPRALLSIRDAPVWWDHPQTLAHGGTRVNTVTPRQAFDGIVYVAAMRPANPITTEPAQ